MPLPLIKPVLADTRFLQDVHQARSRPDQLHLWWLGQSGFLLAWKEHCLLFDPYLSDSLTWKYANTDRPHVRISERVIEPGKLDFVDVVTSSHNHTDHLDPDTVRPLVEANPNLEMVCPEANRITVRERSGLPDERIHGLDATTSTQAPGTPETTLLAGFEIHAIPAAHETIETDAAGRNRYLGFVVRAGPWVVYHSGDTVGYPGLVERLRPLGISVALLPINGRAPERRVAGNLSGPEAAELAREIGAGWVIPCHYDLFAFNTASPEPFAASCRQLGQRFEVLPLGGRWSANH